VPSAGRVQTSDATFGWEIAAAVINIVSASHVWAGCSLRRVAARAPFPRWRRPRARGPRPARGPLAAPASPATCSAVRLSVRLFIDCTAAAAAAAAAA